MPGATLLSGDVRDPGTRAALESALGGSADVVLSDMAPATTGHAATDHLRIVALAEDAFDLASQLLERGGSFVAKVFQGGAEGALLAALKRDFAQLRHAKPPASRRESAETYRRRDEGSEAGDKRDLRRRAFSGIATMYSAAPSERRRGWRSGKR